MEIEQLYLDKAAKYGLSAEFVAEFAGKLTDSAFLDRALKMFVDGHLPYGIATGKDAIDVAAIRHNVASNLWKRHERWLELIGFYDNCEQLSRRHRGVTDIVYVHEARIVAFGNFQGRKNGNHRGIYMADNEYMPDFRWNPHTALGRLRKADRQFYKAIKKAAYLSPPEWFDFNERTVRKRA